MKQKRLRKLNKTGDIGFEVLTQASVQMKIFQDVTPCNLINIYQCVGETFFFALKVEAVGSFETFVGIHQTRGNHISECRNLKLKKNS